MIIYLLTRFKDDIVNLLLLSILTYVEYRAVSGVFQIIDPPTPSPPSECVLSPHPRHMGTLGGEGGGRSIFWKTPVLVVLKNKKKFNFLKSRLKSKPNKQ
jgi:hypothetical protein